MKMRKRAAALAAVILLSGAALPLLAESPGDFAFSRKVVMPDGAGKDKFFAEIELDAEVLSRADGELADIRVMDGKGKFAPYIVERAVSVTLKDFKGYALRETWRGTAGDEEHPMPCAIFQVDPARGEELGPVNRLTTGIQAKEPYSIQVSVEGRRDEGGWTFIKDDSVYAFQGTLKAFIDLGSAVTYNHFRLTATSGTSGVYPFALMAEYDAKIEESRPFLRETRPVLASRIERDGKTILQYDAPPGLSATSISFDVPGRYRRRVDFETKDGSVMRSGFIARAGEDFLIDRVRFDRDTEIGEVLRVIISNRDDEPLEVRGIAVEYRAAKLLFEADPAKSYELLFGNEGAEAPSYDLESLRDFISTVDRFPLALGPLAERAVKKADSGGMKYFFNAAVVAAAFLLGVLAFFALKRKAPKVDD